LLQGQLPGTGLVRRHASRLSRRPGLRPCRSPQSRPEGLPERCGRRRV
ncbi:Amylo-alpha-1,6-glucosidase, partial [Toxoplasma gondii p89]